MEPSAQGGGEEGGRRRRPRRARVLALGAAGLLAIVAALAGGPELGRRLLEARLSRALAGAVRIGGLTIAPIERVVTLRDVALVDPEDPERVVLAVRRVAARFSARALLGREIRIRDLVLEAPTLDLDRIRDGGLNLLRAVEARAAEPAEAPAEPGEPASEPAPEPAPAPAVAAPWRFALDHVRLEGGHLAFRDFAVSGSEVLDVTVDRFEVERLSTQPGAYPEPTRIRITARAEDATLSLDADVRPGAAGWSARAALHGENLPLRRARVYLPAGAWSELEGRLDGDVVAELGPRSRVRAYGATTLRDALVHVPGLAEPALQIGRLDLELREIDLRARRAVLGRATLTGAVLVVAPEAADPVPVLDFPTGARADAGPPWQVSLVHAQVVDARVHVLAAAGRAARDLGLAGTLERVSSEPGARSAVNLVVRDGAGRVAWDGSLGAEPRAQSGTLRIDELDAERTLALWPAARRPIDPAALRGVLSGTLALAEGLRTSGELTLRDGGSRVVWKGDATLDPVAGAGRVQLESVALTRLAGLVPAASWPAALRVSQGHVDGALTLEAGDPARGGILLHGRLRASDLLLGTTVANGPTLAARAVDAEVRAIELPGLLGAPSAASEIAPVRLELGRVAVEGPVISLVRNAAGIIRPPSPEAASGPAPDVAPHAAEPAAFRVQIGQLDADDGVVNFVDRSVTPWYRGRSTDVTLRASELGWPWRGVAALRVDAKLSDGVPLSIEGKGDAQGTTLVVRAETVPLRPFNPYVTALGYGVREGTLTAVSSVWVGPAGFDAKNWLIFHDLDLGGPSGDSLFRREFGVSLSVALALLRDLSGDIAIDVPMWLDRKGFGIRVGDAVRSAVRQALTWALASPLKMLGALLPSGGAARAPSLEPIPFAPGEDGIDGIGSERVDALAALLAASPGLRPTLQGAVDESDRIALRERALRESLGAGEGLLGRVRALANRGIDARLRRHLTGETPALSEADRAELERRRAAIDVPDDRLKTLAATRERSVRQTLADRYGVTEVALASEIDAAPLVEGAPSVRIVLAAAP